LPALTRHFQRHIVGYVALFVALAGTSYAAVTITNGSITAAKLDKHSIGGYVRAWAHVSATGHVIAGSPGAHAGWVGPDSNGQQPAGPAYTVNWRGVKLTRGCEALATLDANGPLAARGSWVEPSLVLNVRPQARVVNVVIGNGADQNVADSFFIALVC
jgi:hypothetical protein